MVLKAVVPVQPAFSVVGVVDIPVKHDTPVDVLNPKVDVQPDGNVLDGIA